MVKVGKRVLSARGKVPATYTVAEDRLAQLAAQATTAARTGVHPELLCEVHRFCEQSTGKKLALRTAWQPAVLQLVLSDGLDQFGQLQPIGEGRHACFRGTHPSGGRQVVL